MRYGSVKSTFELDDRGSSVATIQKMRNSEVEKSLRHYKIRVKVSSPQEEMAEFIKFTREIFNYRLQGRLGVDKEDPSTKPAFIIDYPREGQEWIIVKNYCLLDTRSASV